MFKKPARIVAIVAGLAMLFVESAYATRVDPKLNNLSPASRAKIVRLPGEVLGALKEATLVKSPPDAGKQPITLTLTLKRERQKAFEHYLHEIYDPHSANYHHFLTQREIADRFGPSREEYEGLLNYMRGRGFRLLEGSKNRLTLTMRGTRAKAERALDVDIRDYRIGKRKFRANDRNPALPLLLARNVQAITGLANLARPIHAPLRPLRTRAVGVGAQVETTLAVCGLGTSPLSTTALAGITSRDGDLFGAIVGVLQSAAFGIVAPRLPVAGPLQANLCAVLVGATFYTFVACGVAAGLTDSTLWQTDPMCKQFLTVGCNVLNCAPPPAASETGSEAGQTMSPEQVLSSSSPQKLGLLEFDTFHSSDVKNWLALLNAQDAISRVSEVPVNGGVTTPGPHEDEVLLDIDTALVFGAAPGINVVVYDGPFTGAGTSFQTMFNAMINDGDTVISNSWAYCEDQTTKADVDSIDSILQGASAAGISVFNASGDTGSSCLDGSTNTISVPADSPNATAVGGTTPSLGQGLVYAGEKWWNGAIHTPPTGQGGFGVSKFFARPAYQDGLNASPMRSVPDTVVDADPAWGLSICEADAGGCPNGKLYGGTSMAAPEMAAYMADLNVMLGAEIGNANAALYRFSNTDAFHDAASMGSDFAHVGLGSPDLLNLRMDLSGHGLSAASAGVSSAVAGGPNGNSTAPADGTTEGTVQVFLRDANDFPLAGKTITVATDGGSATVTPGSAVTDRDGMAAFQVTDSTPEKVLFTVTDQTDNVQLTQQPALTFSVPPATSANISGGPSSVSANGNATITVTLQDSLGRPTPGKLVTLSQNGGQSIITGPNPSVTDSNGEIQFSATDVNSESITYTATDVTDGNLPVPGSVSVDFTGNGGCSGGTPPAAPGYAVSTFASGFTAQNFFNGNLNVGDCPGANGMAFGPNGNLYVADMPTGNIYKIPPSGGAADSSTLLTQTAVGAAITGLAFDPSGNLFATVLAPPGTPISSTSSEVIQVDPNTGAVIGSPLVTGLPCLWSLKTDPLSGDLFTDATCSPPDNSPYIWRIENPASSSPTTVVYATTPNTSGNTEIGFAPDGTMYVDALGKVLSITGTNTTNPGTVSTIPNAVAFDSGMAVGGMQSSTDPSPGDSQFLLLTVPGSSSSTTTSKTQTFDLTAATPGPGVTLTGTMPVGDGGYTQDKKIVGPNGCLYLAEGDAVYKITNLDGTCSFGPATQPPAISLTPASESPNPSQGSSVSFTASLHDATIPAGTPVFLTVTGSNPQMQMVRTDAGGQASFSYKGVKSGTDAVTATATVNNLTAVSNPAQVTWNSGQDTTFLSLNLSPKGATSGEPVTLTASLSDVSKTPATASSGQTISFTLGGDSCSATTNSKGNASCSITPSGPGTETLSASFAGTTSLVASNASTGFTVVNAPAPAPTPTPGGRIEVEPIPVTFGATGINVAAKHRALRIYNKGQRKTLTVSLEPLSAPFTILSSLGPYEIPPGQRIKVKLQFAPTVLGKQHETLVIDSSDRRDSTVDVHVRGKGRPGVPYHYATGFHFHKVGIGVTPATITIRLKNTGLGLLKGTVGTLSAPFQVTAGGGAYSIAPGDKLPITVQFTPTDTVHSSAMLNITTSNPGTPTIALPVGGAGVGGHLKTNLTIPAGSTMPVLHLGKTAPSTSVSAKFRIINNGKGLLQGSIGTPSTSFFTVTNPSAGGAFTLQPGTHEPVTVQFDPDASGKFVATLTITVMPPSGPAAGVTVLLKGRGS